MRTISSVRTATPIVAHAVTANSQRGEPRPSPVVGPDNDDGLRATNRIFDAVHGCADLVGKQS